MQSTFVDQYLLIMYLTSPSIGIIINTVIIITVVDIVICILIISVLTPLYCYYRDHCGPDIPTGLFVTRRRLQSRDKKLPWRRTQERTPEVANRPPRAGPGLGLGPARRPFVRPPLPPRTTSAGAFSGDR